MRMETEAEVDTDGGQPPTLSQERLLLKETETTEKEHQDVEMKSNVETGKSGDVNEATDRLMQVLQLYPRTCHRQQWKLLLLATSDSGRG